MRKSLKLIVRMIEKWADDPKMRHEDALLCILNTALKGLKSEK
jgi:hypothetical protein